MACNGRYAIKPNQTKPINRAKEVWFGGSAYGTAQRILGDYNN